MALELDELVNELQTAQVAASADLYAMPATRGQVRFWSLDQLNSGNPALNMPLMWQCDGALDVAVLTRAFAACVERHESLRTTFLLRDGQLMQLIHPHMPVPILLDDVSGCLGEERRQSSDRITRDHAAFRFDLARGPLLALRLIRLNESHHLLLVTMHHIICDGISNGILMRDMLEFYEAGVRGVAPQLPELPIQFADYAVWHEDWCNSEEHERSLDFWRNTLGRDAAPIALPTDADAPEHLPEHKKNATGDIQTLLLPSDLTQRALAYCAREGVTFNVLLFTVFSAMLSRATGRRDLTIGSPCANRSEETEELIGLFMNIQVLRAFVREDMSFRELLDAVNTWTLAAVEHQALPFEDLVHDPYFRGDNSLEIPIFFLYQKSFMVARRIATAEGSIHITPLRSESPGAVFDMMFAVVDREEEGPRLQLEFNPQLHRMDTVRGYLRLFVELMQSGLEDPTTAVDQLPVVSDEARAVVGRGSSTHAPAVQRIAMQESTVDHQRYIAPRDVLERQLAEIWQTTLGIERIGVESSFFSLGAGSLAALRLVTRMNRTFSMEIGLAGLVGAPTIAAVAGLIRRRVSARSESSLVALKPEGTREPLFIVHGVGGNVISFYGLARRIGVDRPVYGIQAQALLPGKPALLRMQDLAQFYIAEMRALQPSGPYHLLGYSFGGTLALEMARQLRAAGQQVAMLGMLDSRTRKFDEEQRSGFSTQEKAHQRVDRLRGNTETLSVEARRSYIASKLHTRAIRYAAAAAATLGFRTLPAWFKDANEINLVAINRYVPKPYEGALMLFRARDQDFPNAALELGWKDVIRGGIEIREVDGNHERLFLEPGIDALAAYLNEALR
ncbi:Thioesterase domain-containing protein [Bryocella elongata]|uniref:Thioesterase domain-containing protein n=1 Tax=Bryocella elongata TaxID=863522 RepID=A0A1H6AW42_9BACT|nr:condensation domain-containing protein [Bryocella elongata]SEG52612.1 Thioesterase domain-containing protein [Bryocella elongata]